MQYKIGDKFIFEIDRIYSSKKHEASRYGIKGFENLVLSARKIDELLKHRCAYKLDCVELSKDKYNEAVKDGFRAGLTEGYDNGLADAWKIAEEVFYNLDYDEVCKIFGIKCANDNGTFFETWSPQSAMEVLAKYRNRGTADTIKFGDEVEAWDTSEWVRFIVTGLDLDEVYGIDENGSRYEYPLASCRKTGRHYDIIFKLEKESSD